MYFTANPQSATVMGLEWDVVNGDIVDGVVITQNPAVANENPMQAFMGPSADMGSTPFGGLTPATTYTYSLVATYTDANGDTYSPAPLTATGTTKPAAGSGGGGGGGVAGGGGSRPTPGAPVNAMAIAMTYDKAQVTWSPGANTTWINVQRKNVTTGNIERQWAHLPPSQSLTDEGPSTPLLQSGEQYFYLLTAVNADGISSGTVATNIISMPIQAVSLTLTPSTVVGGSSAVTGTVTLSAPAPSGGALVVLSSSDPDANVQSSLPIPAGSKQASFPVGTEAVASMSQAEISASFGGAPVSAVLVLLPLQLASINVAPNPVVGGIDAQGQVVLNGAAPAGISVTLSVNDVALANVQESVVVYQGQESAAFPIHTIFVGPLPPSPPPVTVSATYKGLTVTTNLNVVSGLPPPVTLKTLTVSPGTVQGGGAARGTVTLNGPAPVQGTQVGLSAASVDIGVSVLQSVTAGSVDATVPPWITIPSGEESASFFIQTREIRAGDPPASVTIIAAAELVRYALLTITE